MARRSIGPRPSTGRWAALLLLAGASVLAPAGVAAAEPEVRNFTVLVDGKPAGAYRMTITRQGDGSVVMAAQSDVQVKVLLVTAYSYSYRGQEVWKDGLLQRFECTGKEKGKPFAVTAQAEAAGLRVRANGVEHTTRPDLWTTSCWQLPDARFRNQAIPLMGCDSGKDVAGHLQYVGAEKVAIAGRELNCAHYRVTQDVPHEVWYDDSGRLVRHEWVSSGHRTQLLLSAPPH